MKASRKPHTPKNALAKSLAADDYEAKTSHETTRLARRPKQTWPRPFGDPLSGVMLVAEPAVGADARVVDALCRSLAAINLDAAYVTWLRPELLEEILSIEPTALVAIGPAAARAIDSLNHPLTRGSFSEASEGSWFAWTRGASGLKLPALAPALENPDAKRHFWRTFLALRALAPKDEDVDLHP